MRKIFLAALLAATLGCTVPTTDTTVTAYTAEWCRQCQIDRPALDALNGRVPVTLIDVDAQPELARQHSVRTLPTYIVFEHGIEVFRTHSLADALSRF
jgi:thioredoxin-like negative regulator of GroEL